MEAAARLRRAGHARLRLAETVGEIGQLRDDTSCRALTWANVDGGMIFDGGLPFFLGRKVFVGMDGKSISGVSKSTPLWAYTN